MKIIIEAFALRNAKSGTGRYAMDVISRISKEHDVVVITRDPDPKALEDLPSNIKIVLANNLSLVPANMYLYFFLGFFLRKFKCDFAIFLIGCRPLFYNKTYDLVICDFNHKIFPDSVKFITRQIYRASSSSSITGCRNLISISKGTSIKSKDFYGRSADFIINPSLLKFSNISPKPVAGLPDSFSVYVGAIEPRKNICNLLVAHEYAVDSGLISDKLLLVSSHSWLEGEVEAVLNKMHHSAMLTSIDEDELAWIYSHAKRVYMTTYYEGYGMPAAEAQHFGADVICTDIIELREATKDQEIYVGTSPVDILEGISMTLKTKTPFVDERSKLHLDLFESQISHYLSQVLDKSL